MTCNASQPRRGSSLRAAQILLIGYVLGFAVSVATAIAALTAGTSDGSSSSDAPSAALAGYLFLLALALLAAVVSMRAARRRLGLHGVDLGLRAAPVTRRRAGAAAVMYVGLLAAAIEVTITALDWCGVSGSGVDAGVTRSPGALPVETVHSAIAGLVEEPVLLALPIALGRRCRWPWQVTLTVMIAMRISFHLYLGWDCLFVVPWSPITVTLDTGPDEMGQPSVIVTVADEGPGLSADAAAHVFERFYRADAARNRDNGGTGLGLAIVAALVTGHRGRVDVQSEPGHGARFRVVLPQAFVTAA